MEADHEIAAATAICQKVNEISATGGASTIWLACGSQIVEIETAAMEGEIATFGYAFQAHAYKFRADHVVGISYDGPS